MKAKLPYSPSVNHYWGHRAFGKRVIKYLGAKGKSFREDVIKELEGCSKMQGPLSIQLDIYPPDRRKRDIDNPIKPVLDALEHAGVYEDDSQICEMHVYKHPAEKPGRIEVTLNERPEETS